MVPGEEQCADKTIQSTVVTPEEICDLQVTFLTKLPQWFHLKVISKRFLLRVFHKLRTATIEGRRWGIALLLVVKL